jgi:hypothetical protein
MDNFNAFILAKKITTYCTWKEHDESQDYDVSTIFPEPDLDNIKEYSQSKEIKDILDNNYVFSMRQNGIWLREAYEIKDSETMINLLSNMRNEDRDTIFIIKSKDWEDKLISNQKEIIKTFEMIWFHD